MKKVALVVPERQDAISWYEWLNDLENQFFIWQWWKIFTLEKEYDYYDSLKNEENQKTFSIMALESWKIIWNISLTVSYKNRNAVLWVLIWDKKEQWKWFWTEAVELMLKYWFEFLWLYKIKLFVNEKNQRAKRVYEKVWFEVAWILKEEIFDWEKYIDNIYMEIFRKKFLKK